MIESCLTSDRASENELDAMEKEHAVFFWQRFISYLPQSLATVLFYVYIYEFLLNCGVDLTIAWYSSLISLEAHLEPKTQLAKVELRRG